MARDQKPFSRGNVTISIFVADFSISVPRHDRQISWTGSSIFFSSLFLFSLFSPPALLPGSVTSPRRRIYRLDSPSIYIYIYTKLSRAVFYPSHHGENRASPFVPCTLVANRNDSAADRPTKRLRKRVERRGLSTLAASLCNCIVDARLRNRAFAFASKWIANDNRDPSFPS